MSVGLEHDGQRILVRQIAGLIARRIVTYSREGETVEQGERLGIIRFGSRVDVFLPTSAKAQVTLGQSTFAGSTLLARLGAP
jgi:phosphatidylserine decarboxylase